MTEIEKRIIEDACRNADCIGAGRMIYANNAIRESGFVWKKEHETEVFNYSPGEN